MSASVNVNFRMQREMNRALNQILMDAWTREDKMSDEENATGWKTTSTLFNGLSGEEREFTLTLKVLKTEKSK